MSEPRIVKRYANRKLYDTQRSHYVTLDQIAEMIRNGEEVRVLDNNSKEDLTSVTLAQIIFEEEKRQKSFIPLQAMRHIIQSGGASLSELAQQAQARVRSVFRMGEGAEGDKSETAPSGEQLGASDHPADSADLAAADTHKEAEVHREEPVSHNAVREFLERSQQTIDEWQRRVDDRVRHLIDSISPFASLEKEVARLRERIDTLERQLSSHHPGGDASG